MTKVKWNDEWNYYLLTVPAKHWRIIWPDNTQDALHTRKKKLKRDLQAGVKTMPEKPANHSEDPETIRDQLQQGDDFGDILKLHNLSPELRKEFTEQGFHVGFIKNNDGQIEYTIPLPNAKTGKQALELPQAAPANITPTRRKPEKRDHKVLVVFSDAQIDYRRLPDETMEPTHDERAISVAELICKDLKPDEIINLGDTVDLAAFSRFPADSDHNYRTLVRSFQRVHDMYAQLRADSPWAKITEVDSNHNTRLKKFLLNTNNPLYGFTRPGEEEEYPVNTYPYLANLKPLGVDWVSGYGAAEYEYGLEYDKPPIIFKHGVSVVSNGSTAGKESRENPEVNVVRGHTHRAESFYRTTRGGKYLASIVCGVLCRTTGEVPSYHSAVDDRGVPVKYQENWQQGIVVIRDYDGDYQFDHILIRDGKATYNGVEYDGN